MRQMIVSFLKSIYSMAVRQVSRLNQPNVLKQQVVYVMTFPKNDQGLIEAIHKKLPVVVCYNRACQEEAKLLEQLGITTVSTEGISGFFHLVKLVTQNKLVVIDNYLPLLGDIKKSPQQTFYLLWHATGAIKQFGLEDKQVTHRSKQDKARFRRVYAAYDKVFVASKAMGEVFQSNYDMSETQMLYTGFPRTDQLLNKAKQNSQTKQHIVYLPTYRLGESQADVLDIDLMKKELGSMYHLSIKWHPHVATSLVSDDFFTIVPSDVSADELLVAADILITDYSSVAFDYTLIKPTHPIIFYWYDEEAYEQHTGIQATFKSQLEQPICHTTQDVIEQIKQTTIIDHTLFNQQWNTYNDGKATQRVVTELVEKMDGVQ